MSPAAGARRSPLTVLFLTVFIDLMGFGIVIPLLPIFAERVQATPMVVGSTAGLLVGVYSLMQLLFAPLWGALSDRVGRRPVLLVSLSGSAISYVLLGAAHTVPMLLAARVLAGIAGANIPVAQAYIADVTTGAERTRGMGLIGAAFGLGMVIGPAIGGGLARLGPSVPEFAAAALCLGNVLLAAWRLPESLAGGQPRAFAHPLSPAAVRAALAPPLAAILFALFFLVTLCFAALEGNFSLAATHLFDYAPHQVEGLWVYMGLVAVVVQGGIVGRLARRVQESRLVLAGTTVLMLGLGLVPFAGGTGFLLIALALVVTGQGLAGPSLSSLISRTTGDRGHGQVLGLSQSLSSAARVLGPLGAGLVFDAWGARAPYVTAALVALVAVAIASRLARGGRG